MTIDSRPLFLRTALRLLLRLSPGLLLAAASASSAAPATDADQRWISDQLRVDMRTGPSFENRIIDFLPTGTPLTVLGEQDSWIRVRADGKEGWIQSQYSTDAPIAAQKLKQARADLERLRPERDRLAEQLAQAKDRIDALTSAETAAQAKLAETQAELQRVRRTSAAALETEAALQSLQTEAAQMRTRIDRLSDDNAALAADHRVEGIKWGAGAVGLGVVLALIASAIGASRKRSEWA